MNLVVRKALKVLAVLVLASVLVLAGSWPDFQQLRRNQPVTTESVALGEPKPWAGATVTVERARITDSDTLDLSGIDDDAQQVVVVDVLLTLDEPLPQVTGCPVRLAATVDGVAAEHLGRFSASEVNCDGTVTGDQRSRFAFVIPRGEVEQASLFLQIGVESTTWLAVDLLG